MLTEQSRPSVPAAKHLRGAAADCPGEISLRGEEPVARLQNLVREGNVRRVWIKDEEGRTLIEIPLMLGVRGGAPLLPVWAAVGALASVVPEVTIVVQREEAWPRYDD